MFLIFRVVSKMQLIIKYDRWFICDVFVFYFVQLKINVVENLIIND